MLQNQSTHADLWSKMADFESWLIIEQHCMSIDSVGHFFHLNRIENRSPNQNISKANKADIKERRKRSCTVKHWRRKGAIENIISWDDSCEQSTSVTV